jgi:hypothetical protein
MIHWLHAGRPYGAVRYLHHLRSTSIFAALVLALAAAPAGLAANPNAASGSNPAAAHTNATNGKPPSAGNSSSHAEQTDQGVVQSIAGGTVILKELDGSAVSIPVDQGTVILVDGRQGALRAVKPGFVAIAKWKPGGTAQLLQAFNLSPQSGEGISIVKSLLRNGVIVTAANGSTVTIHTNAKTLVLIDGKQATLRGVKTGFTLVTSAATTGGRKPASELRFLSPG